VFPVGHRVGTVVPAVTSPGAGHGVELMRPEVSTPASATPRRGSQGLRHRWDVLLVIAVGGALGSVARWGLLVALPHTATQVPWATLLANLTGAFALGLLMVFLLDFWPPSRYVRPFVGVGVLGGYTTYSTYMLDTRTLLSHGEVPQAFGYLVGTLLTGLVAVWAGVLVARTAVAAIVGRQRSRRRHPDLRSAGDDSDSQGAPDPDARGRSRP
jgi:fluoride exporter